ncbi:MAG: hypothetical protein AABY22_10755 [Nanoarchaeota archaeon]
MYSSVQYLLSGATSVSTGSLPCLGQDHFTVNINTSSFGSNVATGTVNLFVRLDSSDTYTSIYSNTFNNNSGVIVQFDGPIENLRTTLSPLTTGTYTVACRYSSSK